MNNKAKVIAICGVCCAVALLCVLCAGLSGLEWFFVFFAVVASVAVCVPMLVSITNLKYSLLTYLATLLLGGFLGLANFANFVFVLPVVTFCIPFTITKVYGESTKVTATLGDKVVIPDPFDGGDDRAAVQVNVTRKPCIRGWLRWLIYYALMQVTIGLTLLFLHLFTPDSLTALVSDVWFWVVIAAAEISVLPYNYLTRVSLLATAKLLRKVLSAD